VSAIYLIRGVGVEKMLMETVAECIEKIIGTPVRMLEDLDEPAEAFVEKRNQWDSSVILRALIDLAPPDALRLLGVTSHDLCIPVLTFVFGQAQLDGLVSIISTARLKPEFYGLSASPDLTLERACKESIHELGHTFGLVHCGDRSCAMSLSTHVGDVDIKNAEFCRGCRSFLRDRVKAALADESRPRREKAL
jgi:archaemetzincin